MQHLACIMDGNRRYAKKHGWRPWIGHKHGVRAVRNTIAFCLDHKIDHLSLYTFSLENFKRPTQEKDFLFSLVVKETAANVDDLIKQNVRVRFVGDRARFPHQVLQACQEIEAATEHCTALQVHFLFCYGGQQEIVAAAKKLAQKVQTGQLSDEQITPENFAKELWLHEAPPPDLIFRTGGVQRVSNFLLFQAAYSEYYFSDHLWPEITADHLQHAVESFEQRNRNFGQ